MVGASAPDPRPPLHQSAIHQCWLPAGVHQFTPDCSHIVVSLEMYTVYISPVTVPFDQASKRLLPSYRALSRGPCLTTYVHLSELPLLQFCRNKLQARASNPAHSLQPRDLWPLSAKGSQGDCNRALGVVAVLPAQLRATNGLLPIMSLLDEDVKACRPCQALL